MSNNKISEISPTLKAANLKNFDPEDVAIQELRRGFSEIEQSARAIKRHTKASRGDARITSVAAESQAYQYAQNEFARVSKVIDNGRKVAIETIEAIQRQIFEPLETTAKSRAGEEIRRHFKELSNSEQEKLFSSWIQSGDVESIGAIIGRQPYLAGLDTARHNYFLNEFQQKYKPELSKRIKDIEAAMKRYDKAAEVYRNSFLDERSTLFSFDKKKLNQATEAANAYADIE